MYQNEHSVCGVCACVCTCVCVCVCVCVCCENVHLQHAQHGVHSHTQPWWTCCARPNPRCWPTGMCVLCGFASVLARAENVPCIAGRACMVRTPKVSTQAFPTRPRLCFGPQVTSNTLKRWLCVVRPVCAYWWHPLFTARTVWCLERPAQTQWTCSTHIIPCFRPLGVCLWHLFELVLPWFCKFCTRLAFQEISSSLRSSARIQEQQGALC